MAAARFAITDTPNMLPGNCLFCPGSNRDWYIDTFYHAEFHGRLYICNCCLAEMAREAGYMTPDQVTSIRGRVATLAEEKADLINEVMRLERNVDALMDRRSPRVSESLSKHHTDGRPLEDVELPSAGEESVGDREGASAESSDDEGMVVVHADDSGNVPALRFTS